MSGRTTHLTSRLLGYPDDARLLLVNADDFGLCHAVNAGIVQALGQGIVTSTSLMLPCPWALHALAWLRARPEIPFGVHLTVVSEQPLYRWGPLCCRTQVPSLVDETGFFFAESRLDELLGQLELDELEREWRAQIEHSMAGGTHPTHVDSHCAVHVRRDDIFAMTLALAQEYGLALRAYWPPYIDRLKARGVPTNDHPLLDSYELPTSNKAAHYARLLRELPAGLNEWAVHPAIGSAELQAAMPSWRVRQTDLAFVCSPAARALIEAEGITLVDYRAIQARWRLHADA